MLWEDALLGREARPASGLLLVLRTGVDARTLPLQMQPEHLPPDRACVFPIVTLPSIWGASCLPEVGEVTFQEHFGGQPLGKDRGKDGQRSQAVTPCFAACPHHCAAAVRGANAQMLPLLREHPGVGWRESSLRDPALRPGRAVCLPSGYRLTSPAAAQLPAGARVK